MIYSTFLTQSVIELHEKQILKCTSSIQFIWRLSANADVHSIQMNHTYGLSTLKKKKKIYLVLMVVPFPDI